ncbi:hypothetical protein [Litchfieldia salsa]|uniref:Uncharacterized protein n=1 Tax=Litchfieldia salsa TaxID=930152 RepID=A0A1H0RI81_9BACI|nr:hypothetical protein [Litchfieldia salsa]SDP29151.1 hypothetical protein SAMN05216565_102225 [Litchfieldia salsa]
MNSIQDALYNWLTIKIVADARPDDHAAIETYELFDQILIKEHGVTDIKIIKDDTFYHLSYLLQDEPKKTRFPIELIDIMYNQIEQEPEKYKNYQKK